MKNYLKYTPLIIFLSLCVILFLILNHQDTPKNLDSLKLYTYQGKKIEIENNKKYIIRFFSSWCGYCKRDYSQLRQLANKLDAKIIGIVVSDNYRNAAKFVSTNILPYDYIIIDEDDNLKKFFNNKAIPETLIIENGDIIYKSVGIIK